MNILAKYKNFNNFFWRSAIWTLGLPFGLSFGFLSALERNRWSFKGIFNSDPLLFLISFFITGFLFAYLYGRSRWKGMKDYQARLQTGEHEDYTSHYQE